MPPHRLIMSLPDLYSIPFLKKQEKSDKKFDKRIKRCIVTVVRCAFMEAKVNDIKVLNQQQLIEALRAVGFKIKNAETIKAQDDAGAPVIRTMPDGEGRPFYVLNERIEWMRKNGTKEEKEEG